MVAMDFPSRFLIEEHYPWYWSSEPWVRTNIDALVDDQLREDVGVGLAPVSRWFVAGAWFRSVGRNVVT